jgi:hypothetical protein
MLSHIYIINLKQVETKDRGLYDLVLHDWRRKWRNSPSTMPLIKVC